MFKNIKTAEMLRTEALNSVWEAIKAERESLKSGGVQVEVTPGVSKWFHTDPYSMIQYLANARQADALVLAGKTKGSLLEVPGSKVKKDLVWKTMDGSLSPMTIQIALDLVTSVTRFIDELYSVAEMHKEELSKSPDPSKYDYTSGWPLSYKAQVL